jgi:hypothetical protein
MMTVRCNTVSGTFRALELSGSRGTGRVVVSTEVRIGKQETGGL